MKTFRISLEKGPQFLGQTIKGNLNINPNKTINLRSFSFVARGTEFSKFNVAFPGHIMKFSNSELFFNQDLSPFLISAGATIQQDGKLEIPMQIRDIPFNFVVPKNMPESYHGKNVGIKYEIVLDADPSWWQHVSENFVLQVIDNQNLAPVKVENVTTKEITQAEVRAKFTLERTNFSPGEILNGILIIKNSGNVRIRKAKIILVGEESGTGFSEEKIGLIHRKNLEREVRNTIESYSSDIVLSEGEINPFEFNIPVGVKKSYNGKFTKYFWILRIKLDIKSGKDLNIETNIICQ